MIIEETRMRHAHAREIAEIKAEHKEEIARLTERCDAYKEALVRSYAWLGETNDCKLPEDKAQNFLALMHMIEVALSAGTSLRIDQPAHDGIDD